MERAGSAVRSRIRRRKQGGESQRLQDLECFGSTDAVSRMADLLTSHSHRIHWLNGPRVRGKADVAACLKNGQICLQYLGNTLGQRLLCFRCTMQTSEDRSVQSWR